MHPALDCDVRVGDTRRQQLADGTQHKDISRRHLPPLLKHVLQLFEYRVLQDWIDDKDQGGQNAGEERAGAFGAEEREERGDGGGVGFGRCCGRFWQGSVVRGRG